VTVNYSNLFLVYIHAYAGQKAIISRRDCWWLTDKHLNNIPYNTVTSGVENLQQVLGAR